MKRLHGSSWPIALTFTAGAIAAAGYLYLPIPVELCSVIPWCIGGLLAVAGTISIAKRRSAGLGVPRGIPEPTATVTASDLQADEDPPSAEPSRQAPNPDIWDTVIGRLTELTLRLDSQGRISYASPGAAQLLERSPADLVGTSVLKYLPAAAIAPSVAAFKGALQQPGAVIELEPLRMHTGTGAQPAGATVDRARTPFLHLQVAALDHARLLVTGQTTPIVGHPPILQLAETGSDDRFSRIFHSSPDAIVILHGTDGRLIDFNPGFTRVVGYTREQAIGVSEQDLGLWADREAWQRHLHNLRCNPSGFDLETALRDADGNTKPVEMSLRYIELNGELHVLCIARDISKRINAESAARNSEEKFSQVFSQSPDGIVILRQHNLVICDVNDAFCAASGYTRQELIGKPASAFDAFAKPQELSEVATALASEGRLSNRDIVLRAKSGRQIPALLSATLINLDGEPCILCIAKDVAELREAQGRLLASEQRFRGAFENAPIGIVLLDTQGYIFEANRFATDLLDYAEETLEGVHISRLLPAEERSDLKAQLDALTRGREAICYNERRLVCASGLEIWTNCHMVLQRDSEGQPGYCIMQIADITEMKTNQQRMERMAFFDTLTELANRRLFNDRLSHAIAHSLRTQQRAALLYLDLDQFKRVNDTLGHEAGDELLREVAERLLRCVRKEDTVGRPGGDEFTILLYDVRSPADAGQVAEKILHALRQPVSISGHQLVVTTSIGIAVIPDDGMDPNILLKNADLAMYRAKEQGRNNFQFYSEDLNTNAVKRLRTEYELRRALERGEFELYYQPKIRLIDQGLVGVECLIRWRHPERGLISPDGFIEIAEETGDIVEIGNWVLAEACAAGRLMVEQQGGPLSIAVNISPRQFRDPNLVSTIRRCLRRANLDPACLELEITETMLMHDVEAASETVHRLHGLGIRLAIDDFGTGYSSLNYLKKFPINIVKVDKSFVMDIPASADDKAITAAVIAMAHRLNMEVVAEGVETQEQLEFLLAHQCEYAQGYLFGRAVPLDQIRRLLRPKTPKAANLR